jgi:threonyl-tRNA synthetase
MGIAMGLYCWSDNIGSGLPLWLPKGVAIKDALVDYLRQEQLDSGYMPVNTPHIAKSDLFHLSGHMQNYQLNSLRFDDRRIRAKANCDSLRLQKRILIAEQERIPYILVVGDREIQDNMVSVRERNKDCLVSMGLDEFVSYMQ